MAERRVVPVIDDSMSVWVLAGQKAASTWRTKWDRNEEILEKRAFTRDSVDVWRLNEWMPHATQGIPAQIIDENEDYVRSSRGIGGEAAK